MGLKRAWLGLPVVVFLLVMVFMSTPFLATCGGNDDALTELIRTCPRAVELLGADPHPARVGFACGSTKTSGSVGGAHWTLPYTGDRARGEVNYSAGKMHDVWKVSSATLEVDGERVDIVACTGGRSSSVLAQTNADAAQATFEGKVIRSDNATIAVGHECTGKVARERASAFADLQVTCRADANEAEGAPLYAGRGKFTLDVVDPSKRGDDRFEYADEQSATGCRLSAANGGGTLTVFSLQPAWEVVIEL